MSQARTSAGSHVADHVSDEQLVGGAALAHRCERGLHARSFAQLSIDLAELDAAAADLDLIVAPSDELKSLDRLAHDVASAIGALPAHGWKACESLGVERRVEVPGEPDTGDHELSGLAERDRLASASTIAISQP